MLRSKLKSLLLMHFRHILALVLLSLGTWVVFFLVEYFGIGGIRISWTLLGAGLMVAAFGQSLFDFGSRLQHRTVEYSGVFMIGLSWWVWSLNPQFLLQQHGLKAVAHWMVPFFLFGTVPMVFHYINNGVLSDFLAARIISRKKISSAIPVLIVEPGRKLGKGFSAELLANNYTVVDWVVGIASLQPLVGILHTGKRIPIDPAAYKIALIDHEPDGRIRGCTIVKHLKGFGITCVGISTEKRLNLNLVAAGAKLGVQKHVMFAALLAKIITLDELVRTDDLTAVIHDLDAYQTTLDDSAVSREASNALLDLLPEGDD
jgi:hypothetical protein